MTKFNVCFYLGLVAFLQAAAGSLAAEAQTDPAGYVRKGTWVETVIASREALTAAEAKDAGAGGFAPWRVVLSNRDKPQAFKVPLGGAKTLYLGVRTAGKAQGNLANCQLVNKEGVPVPFTFDKSMTKMTGRKSLHAPNKKDKLPAWIVEDTEFAVELNGEYDSFEATAFAAHGDGGDKAVFWVSPSPMLEREAKAAADREAIWAAAIRDFAAPADRADMGTEKDLWGPDWKAGDFKDLAGRYAAACKAARGEAGKLASAAGSIEDLQKVRGLFAMGLRLELAQTMLREVDPAALRRAIEDLTATFGPRYAKGAEFLQRLEAIEKSLPEVARDLSKGDEASLKRAEEVLALQREALLANPLLDFDKVLLVKRSVNNLGLVNNWLSNSSVDKAGYDNEIDVLSPLGQGAALTTVFRPEAGRFVGDVDLNFDADRMLVSMPNANTWQVWELKADGTGLTQMTPDEPKDVESYDACYLPDGRIMFTSTANMQGVPCIGGGGHVANLALLDPASKKIRMLAFEQDHDWCPTVMNDGMVMYLRWEYTDTPHYYTRLIACMNPDGTNQKALYGSNSYWPNAIFFARPIPGHPSQFVGIVGGHHDVPRMGELVIFDPAKGHAEGDGVIQRIPGYGKKVEPIIKDGLAGGSWPLFLHPYPLSDKYYLVSRKVRQNGNEWGIYLVDVFDNMLLLKAVPGYALMEPLPLRKTPRPPIIPDKVNTDRKDAIVYVVDVYRGPGLAGVPRGTVKKLRVFTYTFGYRGMGGHDCFGVESGWDAKRILGTVPVEADGSVMFRAPANTPISVQPLDANGAALQLMRSWMTPMPGEFLSCIGCHESELDVTPNHQTAASQRVPSEIEPWCGPPRGIGFPREVQPVLDKYCVGCHDGKRKDLPNFADIRPSWRGFGESYHNLARYVRRPGPESDYHMLQPMEYHASTSELVQILNKGHHNVRLDAEAWQRLHTWMDLNVPYHATWAETRGGSVGKVGERYREMQKLYANVETNPESMPALPTTRPAFIPPKPEAPDLFAAPQVPGWPFDAAEAAQRQARLGPEAVKAIPLGMTHEWKDTITCKLSPPVPVELKLAHIPPGEFAMGDPAGDRDAKPVTRVRIDKPFWIATVEVTNAMYSLFDPKHDSRFIDMELKDQEVPGYHADLPDQPVIRVNWQEAMAFCEWLSHKTGMHFTLPTEAQWEWACRAGTATPMWFGAVDADFGAFANFADVNIKKFALEGFRPKIAVNPSPYHAFIPRIDTVDDKQQYQGPVGFYKPNPWGLRDMHGNVAEWTRSLYKPYPYDDADGRNDLAAPGQRVVRGGSWFDRPKHGTSAFRLPYEAYQKVYNVGFRVVAEEGPPAVAAARK